MNCFSDNIDVRSLAHGEHDYVVAMRRHFHKYPEPGMKEYETAKRIRSELDTMGIPWFPATETGTIGVIKGDGSCPENILALRADIDALELDELVESDHKSQVPGYMHGCGHDSHAAMLLGAAKIIKERLEGAFPGTIYLLFQPGEETTIGALRVVESGALKGVRAMYGQHIWSYADTGVAMTRGGRMMAGARLFDISFTGKGGHGSALEKCVNPLTAAAATVLGLQSIISQNVSAKDTATVCIGKVSGGSRHNIIPEFAHISGSIRFFSPETEENLCARIKDISDHSAKAYGVASELTFSGRVPSLHTDERLTEVLKGSLAKVLGEDRVMELPLDMGSEDFSEYCALCPCVFNFVGCRSEEKKSTFGHHSSYFTIDEDAMDNGVAAYVQFAVDYFAQSRV